MSFAVSSVQPETPNVLLQFRHVALIVITKTKDDTHWVSLVVYAFAAS